MNAVQAAKELGKAIQADGRYTAYMTAKDRNDNDKDLQDKIGEFNLKRQNLNIEMTKNERSQDKINALNAEIQKLYGEIMSNVNMAEFTVAKSEMDDLVKEVTGIINLCCEGADPDTAEYSPSCGGSCSSCAGCG